MKYYFIRVNGSTIHDDPKNKDCFVEKEPERFKRSGYSNYLDYCFEHNFVRIGWPDVGDLRTSDRRGAKSKCYDLNNQTIIKPHIREYLLSFSEIQPGAILTVPDRDNPGDIYICQVVKPYWYQYDGPYECAHRVGVKWDIDNYNKPLVFTARQLGFPQGGWWRRAFHEIKDQRIIAKINTIRNR